MKKEEPRKEVEGAGLRGVMTNSFLVRLLSKEIY